MATWEEKESAIRALERQGKVNPVDLIEAAKSPDHPCHNDFTWDIQAAAEERWRDQARAMIRRCKFDVIYEDVTTPVVQYVPCGDDETVFLSLPKIRSSSKTQSLCMQMTNVIPPKLLVRTIVSKHSKSKSTLSPAAAASWL
jgi:hypothetical protein